MLKVYFLNRFCFHDGLLSRVLCSDTRTCTGKALLTLHLVPGIQHNKRSEMLLMLAALSLPGALGSA